MNQKTTDYSIFNPNPNQRKYEETTEKELIEKMSRYGFLESGCVSCYKEKGKLYLNTGHHRVKAAKALKLPVWYVIEHKWDTGGLISEGTSTRNWNLMDVCHIWANEGRKDYEILLNYVTKGLPMRYASSLLRGEHAASGNARIAIRSGTFKVKSTANIDKILATVNHLKAKCPEAGSMDFVSSLSALLFVPGFSLDRLIAKIQTVGSIEKTPSRHHMLDQLEEIYNFRSKDRENVAFQAREILRNRGKAGIKVQPKAA